MNALVRVTFTIDLPEERLEALVGRSDDGSVAWIEESVESAEAWVLDNLSVALDFATDAPDVECVS